MEVSPQDIVSVAIAMPLQITVEHRALFWELVNQSDYEGLGETIASSVLSTTALAITFYEDALESVSTGQPTKSRRRAEVQDQHMFSQMQSFADQIGIQNPYPDSSDFFIAMDQAIQAVASGAAVNDPFLTDGFQVVLTREVIEKRLRHFLNVWEAVQFLFPVP